ncbi:MAG: hypothetical protein FWG17_01550 [Desulfovibrionaceae bacterium]|nr:hypothetical protein [Desulfovibrionaceae bacterium]
MIGVFTYDAIHRKTYDVLCLLKVRGYSKVAVFAESFHYQKKFKPLIEHRPAAGNIPTVEIICRNLNFDFYKGFSEDRLQPGRKILICGSRLIDRSFIQNYTIINAHPGYLPIVRGLDALKWAIYEGNPIGVTSHVLGDDVDAGLLIDRKLVPIWRNDTFHAVAQRQYDMEVEMLVDAIEKAETSTTVLTDEAPLHRRMPHAFETHLLARFQALADQAPLDARCYDD